MVGFYELRVGEQSIGPSWNWRMRPTTSLGWKRKEEKACRTENLQ